MAKVPSYSNDSNITVNDRLLGTDGDDANKTKNYSIGELLDFFRNGITVGSGTNGQDGQDGEDGLSAYQIALNNGFAGTEAEWLASLQGQDGEDGSGGTLPYTIFRATLTQTGTSAPTVTINENTLGYIPPIGYVGIGNTGIIITGLVASKTHIKVSPKSSSSKQLVPFVSISGNIISVKTYNLANAAFENDMLIDTPIEIIVYP